MEELRKLLEESSFQEQECTFNPKLKNSQEEKNNTQTYPFKRSQISNEFNEIYDALHKDENADE